MDLDWGWAQRWQSAGFGVVGWGWLQDDPVLEAELAVELSKKYRLDGYIANAETAYENAGAWKSRVFVRRFRELAPDAPLAVSVLGYGAGARPFDFKPWLDAGAVVMPQAYTSRTAISVNDGLAMLDAAGVPREVIVPTLGTSGFDNVYPVETYIAELRAARTKGYNVWLLDSTTDDVLRALGAAGL